MKPRVRREAARLVACAVAVAAAPTVAAGQVRLTEDRGYIGRDTGTDEVDRCEVEPSLDPAQRSRLASEHYERGETLYNQGEYEGAIDEFVAAYCHAPHYEMLYNIAQSFERRIKYEKAVAYFERYILETPDDMQAERERVSFRVQVLRNLPARIRVATVPRGATVTLSGESGITARGTADSEEPIEVPTGTYTMTVEAPGHEPITETIRPRIGQPYSYYFRLEPKKGTARISTAPSNARIFIDQKLVAVGTYVDRLPIGTYDVTVEAPDRDPASRQLEITAGGTTTIRVELPAPPDSGRTELLIASTVGGGIWGASAFGTIFGDDTFYGPFGGLVGLGIGFGGGYYGVPDDIPVGSSSYIIGGTLIGAAEGLAAATFFACDSEIASDGGTDITCNSEAIASVTLASGVAGVAFTAATADRFDLSAGDAALINSGALWGSVAGGLFFSVFDADLRVRAPLLFAGLNLGLVTGATLASRYEISRGHSALIDLSGLGGMIAGVAVADLAETSDTTSGLDQRVPHFALGGLGVGLIVGSYLTRNMDEPDPVGQTIQPNIGAAEDTAGQSTMTLGFTSRF